MMTRRPINGRGDIGDPRLESLADDLMYLLHIARYSRRYSPLRKNEVNTDQGKRLFSWLNQALEYTPFGINYVFEKEPVMVSVEIREGEVKESKLCATAGVYALFHKPDRSIITSEVGIVASFEDLIKVYSLKLEEGKPRWDDVGAVIARQKGNLEYTEDCFRRLSNSEKPLLNRPVVYSHVKREDGFRTVVDELDNAGFPREIDHLNLDELCSGK